MSGRELTVVALPSPAAEPATTCGSLARLAVLGAVLGGSASGAAALRASDRDGDRDGRELAREVAKGGAAGAAAAVAAGAVAGVVARDGLLHLGVMFAVGAGVMYALQPSLRAGSERGEP